MNSSRNAKQDLPDLAVPLLVNADDEHKVQSSSASSVNLADHAAAVNEMLRRVGEYEDAQEAEMRRQQGISDINSAVAARILSIMEAQLPEQQPEVEVVIVPQAQLVEMQEIEDQEIEDQEIEDQEIEDQEIEDQEIEDVENFVYAPTTLRQQILNRPYLTTLWPYIYSGLLVNDVIAYSIHSEKWFNTNFNDVFFGTPLTQNIYQQVNQMSLTHTLGSDDVKSRMYWAGISFLIIDMLMQPLLVYLRYRHPLEQNANSDRIKKIAGAAGFMFGFYAYSRAIEIIIQKTVEATQYHQNKENCQDHYDYVAALADYVCSVCGDWEDIPFRDIFAPQTCLDALLSKPRSPQELLKKINRFQKYNNFVRLDLSAQPLVTWADDDFASVFSQFAQLNFTQAKLNLSQPTADTLLSNGKWKAITPLIQNSSVELVDVRNMRYIGENCQLFFDAIKFSHVKEIILKAVTLRLNDAFELSASLPFFPLQKLLLENNQLQDQAMVAIADNLPNTTTILSVLDNPLGGLSLNAISNAINKGYLKEIALSSFYNVGHDEWTRFGESLRYLTSLQISDILLSMPDLAKLMPYIKESSLQRLKVSNINLSDEVAAQLFFANLPSSLEALDISKTRLMNHGQSSLSSYLVGSRLTELNLSGNSISLGDFNGLISSIFHSSVKHLNLENTDLTDDHLRVLTTWLAYFPNKLEAINLACNMISDDISVLLVQAMTNSSITSLTLNNNDIGKQFVAALVNVTDIQLKKLDISHTKITGTDVVSLVNTSKRLRLEEIYANDVTGMTHEDTVQIAKNIITSKYSLYYLDQDNLNKNEGLALNQSHASTRLQLLNLINSTPSIESQRILDRASFPADMQINSQNSHSLSTSSRLMQRTVYNLNSTNQLNSNILLNLSGALLLFYVIYQLLSKITPFKRLSFFSQPQSNDRSIHPQLESRQAKVTGS